MLLATTCPHCQTTFRVANDQLKLQAGLVRCGICHQVFNGIENLAGANSVAAKPLTSRAAAAPLNVDPLPEPLPAPLTEQTQAEASTTAPEFDIPNNIFTHLLDSKDPLDRIEPVLESIFNEAPAPIVAASEPSSYTVSNNDKFIGSRSKAEIEAEVQALLDADLQAELLSKESALDFLDSAPLAKKITPALSSPKSLRAMLGEPLDDELMSASADAADANGMNDLSFIRQAHFKKRMRMVIGISIIVLLLLLAAQATYLFRNLIAASYPASKNTLMTMCRYAKCQIQLPAQIETLSYEADELHSLAHENTFEFSLLMHNHSSLPQAWPHIELTLKNAQKQAVLRRVFAPVEYLANANDIAAGIQENQEQSVKMYFEVSKVKASDYVVAIFYP